MAKEHREYKVDAQFAGRKDGMFVADLDWADDGTCSMTGEARLKFMGKWLVYPFDPKANGVKNADGSEHFNAYLEGKMGNGTLDAEMDVAADGTVTGKIPLLKGVVITFKGPTTRF